jgi:hypothetical protein
MAQGLEEKLLRALYRHYPKTRGAVECVTRSLTTAALGRICAPCGGCRYRYVSIGTPLTNVYYLGRPDSYVARSNPAPCVATLHRARHAVTGTASSTRPSTTRARSTPCGPPPDPNPLLFLLLLLLLLLL